MKPICVVWCVDERVVRSSIDNGQLIFGSGLCKGCLGQCHAVAMHLQPDHMVLHHTAVIVPSNLRNIASFPQAFSSSCTGGWVVGCNDDTTKRLKAWFLDEYQQPKVHEQGEYDDTDDEAPCRVNDCLQKPIGFALFL